MPDIWMDVDTALAEVPVNLFPLTDDSDFKTRETAVAYNAAGMDLVWNFVTTGGSFTQTAVTPTTSGVYDWTHQGDGIYTIEIPASGGASINNDTEGFGWFSGVATGVLPWRGPVIGFRAAGLNDKLIDDAYSTTRGLAGTALPAAAADAAGGLPISDAGGLDLDAQIGTDIDAILADTGTDGVVVAAGSKTGYTLSAAGVQAIWDALSSALTTVGSIGKRLVDYLTGDIFARIGAPAGASVSADVAAVKGDTAAISGQIDTLTGPLLTTKAEVTSKPAATAGLVDKLAFSFHALTQKRSFDSGAGTETIYQSNGSSQLATRNVSETATTQTFDAMS
jgi:hypothetical protein